MSPTPDVQDVRLPGLDLPALPRRVRRKPLSVIYRPVEQCDLEEPELAHSSRRHCSEEVTRTIQALASMPDNLVSPAVPCTDSGLVQLRSTHPDPW
jgi:hypothetical protein